MWVVRCAPIPASTIRQQKLTSRRKQPRSDGYVNEYLHQGALVDVDPILERTFQFASIQDPLEAKDREFRRQVRSHAVKRGIQEKKQQAANSANQEFQVVSFDNVDSIRPQQSEKATQTEDSEHAPLAITIRTPSITRPIQLPVEINADVSKLKHLLRSGKSQET